MSPVRVTASNVGAYLGGIGELVERIADEVSDEGYESQWLREISAQILDLKPAYYGIDQFKEALAGAGFDEAMPAVIEALRAADHDRHWHGSSKWARLADLLEHWDEAPRPHPNGGAFQLVDDLAAIGAYHGPREKRITESARHVELRI